MTAGGLVVRAEGLSRSYGEGDGLVHLSLIHI